MPMTKEQRAVFHDFMDAAVHDQQRARRLLQKNPALLQMKSGLGETPLHYLAVENYVAAVAFLAKAGSPVDTLNDFGETPLLEAAKLGYAEMVQLLLSLGADLNIRDHGGAAAIHKAAASGSSSVLELLLKAGADVHAKNNFDEGIVELMPRQPKKREPMLAVLRRHGYSENSI